MLGLRDFNVANILMSRNIIEMIEMIGRYA